MFTLVIAQRLGLESDLTLGLALLEGVLLTIALMLLAERYLLSTTSVDSRPTIVRPAEEIGATADTSPAEGSWWLSLRDCILRTVARARGAQLPLRAPSQTAL